MFHQGVLNLSISFNSRQTVLSYTFLFFIFFPGFPFPLPPYSLYLSSPPFFSTLRHISPAVQIHSTLHVTSFYFPFTFHLDFLSFYFSSTLQLTFLLFNLNFNLQLTFLSLYVPIVSFPLHFFPFSPSLPFPYLYFPSLNIYLIPCIYFYSTLQLTLLSFTSFHLYLIFPFLLLFFHLSS